MIQQFFCCNQAALCQIFVNTNAQSFLKKMTDSAFADKKLLRNLFQINFFSIMLIDISHDLIQQFRFFPFQMHSRILHNSPPVGKDHDGISCNIGLPSVILCFRFFYTSEKHFL